MVEVANFLLDILAELGGGRGAPHNALAFHLLGIILWTWPTFTEARHQWINQQPRELLLLFAFLTCLLIEVSLFTMDAMLIEGAVSQAYLHPFWPPIELFLLLACRLLLAAAFLHLLLRSWPLAVNFLGTTMILAMVAYSISAILWASAVAQDATENFSHFGGSWFFHLTGFALLCITIMYLRRSDRRIRIPIISAFALLAIGELLAMTCLTLGSHSYNVLDPIKGHLSLWAIPLLAYASLRVRQVSEKRVEQSLQNSQRLEALGQLSSGIAHDFNNHLQVILGYVELARDNQSKSDKLAVPLDRIEEAAEAAGALVKQLLTFSRGHKTDYEPVDLNEVITGLTTMVSRLLGPDLKLQHDLDMNAPPILADRRMMEQIIINLIVNARDAMNNQGVIHVETHATPTVHSNTDEPDSNNTETQLVISDSGIGMDKATLSRACEPFFTTKPVGQGTGLGLATVYSIVQKHGGSVAIESKPDLYTRVKIQFPSTEESPVHSLQTTALTRSVRGHETILLCEDEMAIRDFCIALLEAAGYSVLVANDGQHAVNIANTYEGKIDLCLFDVIMPGLNGYQTFDRISKLGQAIPAIFITGSTSRAESVRTTHTHLQKPFNRDTLLEQVSAVLGQPIQTEYSLSDATIG